MKLVKMMPFLDQASKDELVERVISKDVEIGSKECVALYPFLSKDNLNALIKAHIEGKINVSIVGMLPFMDDETLNGVADKVIDGTLKDVDMDALLPFMPDEAIKKMFEAELNKKQE